MSVKDVIKSSIYESLGSGTGLPLYNIALIMFAACLIGVYIFIIYKTTSKAAFYSRDLNVSLAGLTVVVAAIMIAMQSNLIVSLGMVGALSIVRFRNAVKNPLDLLYLFWSVSAGIICGVGLYLLAVFFCMVMTALLIALEKIPNSKASALLVLKTSSKEANWEKVRKIIGKHSKYWKERSRSIKNGDTEVIIELKTAEEEALLKELEKLNYFRQMNFLFHDGEFRA